MDFKPQSTQTSGTASAQPSASASRSTSGEAASKKRGGGKATKWVAILVVLVVILGALWYFVVRPMQDSSQAVDSSKFQAVFLTNGQVYFGKIKSIGGSYADIQDIYYLQVQQPVQPASDKNSNSQVSLTKLGNELHGPTDEMHIASDQILFWENLKDDGTVVKAIKQYETK